MERVLSLIDGFNLYHAIDDLGEPHLKWVDLWKLSETFVSKRTQRLIGVYYFSAHATWLVGAVQRHRAYVKALSARGVTPILGHFKPKDRRCRNCGAQWVAHEEKETDVNIAVALLRLAYKDEFDRALLITRDSDLAPAVRALLEDFPHKRMTVVAPPNRGHSGEILAARVEKARIRKKHLERCLLPSRIQDAGGNIIALRPQAYDPPGA